MGRIRTIGVIFNQPGNRQRQLSRLDIQYQLSVARLLKRFCRQEVTSVTKSGQLRLLISAGKNYVYLLGTNYTIYH